MAQVVHHLRQLQAQVLVEKIYGDSFPSPGDFLSGFLTVAAPVGAADKFCWFGVGRVFESLIFLFFLGGWFWFWCCLRRIASHDMHSCSLGLAFSVLYWGKKI